MAHRSKFTVSAPKTSFHPISSSPSGGHLPDLWPKDVSYTGGVIYDGREICEYDLCDDLVSLKQLANGHPAYEHGKGKGVFANRNISKGTVIGEYAGVFFQLDQRPKVCF